jgi:hypothetical protein
MKIINKISDIEVEQTYKDKVTLRIYGGYFQYGMRWKQYINHWKNIMDIERLEMARTYIISNKIKSNTTKFSNVNLLFDDDAVVTFTHRGWGDLLAATWSQEEDTDYCYALFGW